MPTTAEMLAQNPRPTLDEIDAFGMTHSGLVRKVNADHFVIASLHRTIHVHGTSLPEGVGPQATQNRGYLMIVADGVGGLPSARDGSAEAVRELVHHLLHATELTSSLVMLAEPDAIEQVRNAVLAAHARLVAMRGADDRAPATTVTMFVGFWPRVFIVNAGDSRYYRLRDGVLERFTVDQTMAEALVEQGALTREKAETSRLKHVLYSAVGNEDLLPEVRAVDIRRADRHLLCTDGLTKHVSDAEIREALARDASSEATVRGLVDLALQRGGSDNVTVAVLRIAPASDRAPAPAGDAA
ncbi:MAG TPA: protein phosphatase 2C domain-containing protein [Gemmatimonadaceae bacterium]|nr:protein phosphatase 2C domain-containing protein [Gemmatimonadaceae bacterium]